MDTKTLSTSIATFAAKLCNELIKNKSVVSSPLSAEFMLALLALGAEDPAHGELLTALGIPDDDAELNKSKSVVSSPLSAEFVLALLTLGAEDPAHAELLTALGIPDDDAIRSGFSTISERLRSLKGVTLNVANRIYVKSGPYELEPKLEEDAIKVFDAGIQKTNFSNGAAAAQIINKWVEDKTNKKIKDLISPDSFDDFTRMVLVNALYFKGNWENKFNPQMTEEKVFHLDSKTTIKVPMMYKEADYKFGHSQGLGAKLLEMPYVGNEASMVIVLPDEVEGLNSVMQKLADGHDLIGDLQQMFKTKVQLTLPKFKIETEIDLIPILTKLGISSIFSQGPTGLDKMLNPREPLYVSKAVQKAFIEVNEEGAEAAAATAFAVAMTCAFVNFEPPKRFEADRPFLVIIYLDYAPYFVATYRGGH